MGNTSSRQNTYQQYHRNFNNVNRESDNTINEPVATTSSDTNIDLKSIDMERLNYYEVLNVSKDFTWEELKESYRKLAINTHPDKPNGNKELFNIITYSFKKLATEYKDRYSNVDHNELKNNQVNFLIKLLLKQCHIQVNRYKILMKCFQQNSIAILINVKYMMTI